MSSRNLPVADKLIAEGDMHPTVHDLAKCLQDGEQIDAVLLIGFSHAFDKVPHVRLEAKIHYYGI